MHSTNIASKTAQAIKFTSNYGCTCSCGGNAAVVDTNELIRLRTVLQITGISRAQVYALMRQEPQDRFPKPVKLGRATAWVRKEINDWVQQRIAERDTVAKI